MDEQEQAEEALKCRMCGAPRPPGEVVCRACRLKYEALLRAKRAMRKQSEMDRATQRFERWQREQDRKTLFELGIPNRSHLVFPIDH